MQELEKKAYIYSVEAIGFAKTLEKDKRHPEQTQLFKTLSGKIYTMVADSHKAESNKDFADTLRECKNITLQLEKLLSQLEISDSGMKEQKKQLEKKLQEINNKLNDLLSKIIY
jgi:predicted  nucleic acid-binding Zn-ribbon protein